MSRKQIKYPPLQLVIKHDTAIRKFEKAKALRVIECAEDEVSVAVDYAVTAIYEQNNFPPARFLSEAQKHHIACLCYDYAIATVVSAYWSKCKQVYTFSKEFYDMLLDMDDFEIGWSLFDYLPYDTFYIEIEGHSEIEGVLVKYTKGPKSSILYTICAKPGSALDVNSGIVDPRESRSYKSFFETEVYCSKVDIESPDVILVKQVLAFTLQACMYLCAKNADIEENPFQKRIYHPTSTVRNKFSEVRKWDVGVRVVREHKALQNVPKPSTNKPGTDEERRRPRQHWRKAHWHTYWVGKGRAKRELKFIAPVLVNDNDDENTPIVIHE